MVTPIVIVLLVLGSVGYHFLTPWWLTPLSSNWASLDNALLITIATTGIVFIIINGVLVYCLIRFRHQEGGKAAYDPENTALEKWLSLVTATGIVILLAPGLMAWNEFVNIPQDAKTVEVLGEQWRWSYRFPGEDGVLGTAGIEWMDVSDNPFGLNPKDPYGADDILVESGELHLAVNQPMKLIMRTKDVLHNFYVPHFRAKMDLVPGTATYFWMTPTITGTYEILCAELCGVGHHAMRGTVVVEEQAAFDKWLGEWSRFGDTL